jgi:preprotein translocase subunit YajC
MRGLSALVVWFGVVLFSAAGLLLLFYTAALLLPIILAVFVVSLVVGWYRQAKIRKAFENLKPFFGNGETTVKSGGRKSKIIDAEFEVVDEKDRKN